MKPLLHTLHARFESERTARQGSSQPGRVLLSGFAWALAVLALLTTSACSKAQTPAAPPEPSWQSVLATMPLVQPVKELNRTNAVPLMLKSFGSNNVVRALVFVPGATDEFFFFRRARAVLTQEHPTLLDAVVALTNQTHIRATFQPPLLLLHTDEDPLEPVIEEKDAATVAKLRVTAFVSHLESFDHDWDYLLPILVKSLGVRFSPGPSSSISWDFYRHSFATWNLTGWEALRAIAMAGKTSFAVEKDQLTFRADARTHIAPKFD